MESTSKSVNMALISAIVAVEQFVHPLIKRLLGVSDAPRRRVPVVLTRKIASKLGVEEFLRVKLGEVGDRIVATPLPRGAGTITSITEADGIIRVPNPVEGIPEAVPQSAKNETETHKAVQNDHQNSKHGIARERRPR